MGEIIALILIWIASLAGTGMVTGLITYNGGYNQGFTNGYQAKPSTNLIIQNVESRTVVNSDTKSEANQSTVTINCTFLDGKKAELLMIQFDGISNFKIDRYESNSNYIRTNID